MKQIKILLKPEDIKPSFHSWNVKGVLNPGGERMLDGRIMLYARVAETVKEKYKTKYVCPRFSSKNEIAYEKLGNKDILKKGNSKEIYLKDGLCRLPTISHLRKVILDKSGTKIEEISDKMDFFGTEGEGEYGIEDARITKIGNKYYMTYVGVSTNEGVSTYLASSENMENWNRLGLIFREQNKDVVLFPEKIGGKYVALNRPESNFNFAKPGIWISYSKDLIYWGKESNLIRPRENSWEGNRIGGGCPPIKTSKGWLVIYHGVKDKEEDGRVYSAGVVLLDLKNPEKIIARSSIKVPLIKPILNEEKYGFIDNVVFPTAAVLTLDKKSLLIYSGGADRVVSVRKIKIKDIFKHLKL